MSPRFLSRLIWHHLRDLLLHRYFRRILLATLLLVLLPFCITVWSTLSYSMDELKSANSVVYQQKAKAFSDSFTEKLGTIYQHAAQLSSDTRDPKRNAFQLQRDLLLGPPVNYTVFLTQLEQYEWSICNEWGVYYQDYDILFSGGSKYTLETYLTSCYDKMDTAASDTMNLFFLERDRGVRFCPQYGSHSYECLFVGIPVKMGLTKDSAVLFYRLDGQTRNLAAPVSSRGTDAQAVLFDNQTAQILFMSGVKFLPAEQIVQMYQSGESSITQDGMEYSAFFLSDEAYQWSCMLLLPMNQVNANEMRFYQHMQLLLFFMTLMLLMMLFMLVYFNYRPMQKTLAILGLDSYNEWESLQSEYSSLQGELLEHNQCILDLLLKNLLYNVPISEANAARLGLLTQGNSYLVCVMAGTLNSQERVALTDALHGQMNVIASITDILALDLSVIICRSGQAIDHDAMLQWVTDYFHANLAKHQAPAVGVVVDSINLIHESYTSCFSSTASDSEDKAEPVSVPDPDDKAHTSRQTALWEQVEDYLQQNLGDNNLDQTSVADYFGVSVYSISRLFKNLLGIGFVDYVNNLRLETACKLLTTTTESVTEVSEHVGFSNSSYFSRLFKQKYEVSPSRFRKEFAENAGAGEPEP